MDFARAFTFVFDEDRYVSKLAVGAGLVLASIFLSVILIGFLGFFILAGYGLRLLENVRAGRAQVLPEWDDWGGDLGRGFKLFVVGFIWALPAIILSVPLGIGGALTDGGDAAQVFGAGLLLCAGLLSFVYALFVMLITPGYTIAFARDGRIASGLQLTEIWAWTRRNIGQVIVVVIVFAIGSMIITAVAGIVGAVLCGIGLILTVPLSAVAVVLFQNHLYGQLARQYPMGGQPSRAPAAPDSAGPAPSPAPAPPAPTTPDREQAINATAADVGDVIEDAAASIPSSAPAEQANEPVSDETAADGNDIVDDNATVAGNATDDAFGDVADTDSSTDNAST